MLCTICFCQAYAICLNIFEIVYKSTMVSDLLSDLAQKECKLQIDSVWFFYKFLIISSATTKEDNWAGNKIISGYNYWNLIRHDFKCFTIPQNQILSIMESIQSILKDLPYTTSRNLSKLCSKIISRKFVLRTIRQLKTSN